MKLLVDFMGWFGDGNIHKNVAYKSNNPYTIAKQLDIIQKTKVAGLTISGVRLTWQGPLASFVNQTAQTLAQECGERGLLFCLLIDPWCAKLGLPNNPTQNVINALNDPTAQAMLNGPSYVPEKYVSDFDTGADLATLAATFPTLKFLAKGVGFSWLKVDMSILDSQLRNSNCVSSLISQQAGSACKMAGIVAKFNDSGEPTPVGVKLADWTGTRDLTQSVWGGKAARQLDGQAGNLLAQTVAGMRSGIPYACQQTWNDYDEDTQIEAEAAIIAGEALS